MLMIYVEISFNARK